MKAKGEGISQRLAANTIKNIKVAFISVDHKDMWMKKT